MRIRIRTIVTAVIAVLSLTLAACAASVPRGLAACDNQPNMEAAGRSFERAIVLLRAAEADKGGWREAAVTASERALYATVRGCQYADSQ